MSTKKPKAWRGKQYNPWGDRMSVSSHPMKGTTDCTVYPDGAPLPVDRQVATVIRAARSLLFLLEAESERSERCGAGCNLPHQAVQLSAALANLDRKRAKPLRP